MRFTAARTSMFGAFALGIAVVTLFEAPVLHLLLHRAPWWTRALLAAVNIATLVWILRARRRMRAAAHTLDDDALIISIPGKWHGTIPVALITSIRRISPPPGSSRPRHTLRITPLDTPNVELSLRAPATLHGTFGIARSASRIQLFVDDPDALISAINTLVVR